MNNIDSFLETWKNKSSVSKKHTRAREFDGVLVELSKSGRTNTVRLNALKTTSPKNGLASHFISWLIKEADKNKFNISLCAQPFGHYRDNGPSREQLEKWLSKYGFKAQFTYEDQLGTEMYRYHK